MLEKRLAKSLIVEYQKVVNNIKLIKRNIAIDYKGNNVFVGLRRAGKSYLLYQCIQELINNSHSLDEILFFNFEDDRISELTIKDLDTIKLAYEEIFETKPIFFLDEIQIVEGWEKFARRLVDTGYQVFITGSNAKMLSSEIATTLGGRYYIKELFPFSFSEYLKSKQIELQKNWQYTTNSSIIRNFEPYLNMGGLPEVIDKDNIFKREWLSSLFNKIYFNDILARYSVRNEKAMRLLIRKFAESAMQPISYSRIASIISSTGCKIKPDTIAEYCQYLHDTWLMFSIENYASKLQEKVSVKKYYFIDNGFITLFNPQAETLLLENMVAITLRKNYQNELTYFNTNIEVDFYLFESKQAYQVAYSIKDASTRHREINALLKLNNYIPQNKMFIITKDEEETIKIDNLEICVLPIWKWILLKELY